NKLETKEFEEVKVSTGNIEEIEANIIKENMGQVEISMDEEKLIHGLMQVLDTEKEEGELNRDFEERLKRELDKMFE
ncbi:hypothetical protein KY312_01785, partial [Candidatus Woesearchaeota archaeon]|nr:hypothetical protein [Candidatus Woesearchaeota archaeon]